MNLIIIRKLFTSKSVWTGPSSYEKRIYRAAVSQKFRKTDLNSQRAFKKPLVIAHYINVSQQPGRGPVPGPDINYTGQQEVLLEVVIYFSKHFS